MEREFFEEFGVKTKTGEYITSNEHDYGTFQIKLLGYYSTYLDGEFNLTDHDEIEWVNKDQLSNYDLAEADILFVKILLNEI